MKKIIPVLGLLVATSSVYAQSFDTKQIYFGGGLGYNKIDNNNNYKSSDAVGFQVFAGVPLNLNIGKASTAIEVGYMDSGNFDNGGSANGLWSTGVISLPLNNNLNLVGRLGYDFGDDDGVMIGGGLGMTLANKMEVRYEYVVRDHIDSLQVNLVIHQ